MRRGHRPALAARRCWSRSNGPGCSWCRWMRCAAGGATTTCSPTCSAPACRHEQPGRVPGLHRNAAAWYAEHGLADDAIRHAVAAGEMTWAARLIEQHFDELFYLRGEGATIQRWLSALPADLVRSRPRLLLAQAFLASHGGRVETVEPLLDAAEQAYASAAGGAVRAHRRPGRQHAGERPRADRAPSRSLSRPAPRRRRGHGGVRLAGPGREPRGRVAAELYRPGIPGRGRVAPWSARGSRARLRVQHRRVAAAGRPVDRWPGAATTSARSSGPRAAWTRPSRPTSEALRCHSAAGRPSLPAAGLAYVGLAEVAYQRNELDAALRHVTEGIALCRQLA